MWVDAADYSIRQFELVDANGVKRRVAISNVKSNPSLPASAFRFVAPKGARIVDGL
ncbi:lipoprotein chaperone [compost metagenome]